MGSLWGERGQLTALWLRHVSPESYGLQTWSSAHSTLWEVVEDLWGGILWGS